MHLGRSGWQCPSEAVEGDVFCADHVPILDMDTEAPKSRFPWVYQLTAFILLLMFLASFYRTIEQLLGR